MALALRYARIGEYVKQRPMRVIKPDHSYPICIRDSSSDAFRPAGDSQRRHSISRRGLSLVLAGRCL